MSGLIASLRKGRGLPAFALGVLGFMVLVILWGAVVRATGSGAGCGNHWPLCNGDFFPHHPRLATVIEFTHRSMSGICTFLVAGLLAWTFLAHPRDDRARRAAVSSAVLLVTEALLGAVLVKGGFVENNASNARVLMQCVHFTNTMLLLGALTLTWWWLRADRAVDAPPTSATAPTRSVAWLAVCATIVVGATGSVAALADTLFPSPSLRAALAQDFSSTAPLLVRMRWVHPATAAVACVAAVVLGWRMRRSATGQALLACTALQLLLGPLDVLLLAPIWLQVLHLLGADLFWITLVAAASTSFLPAASPVRASRGLVDTLRVPV